MDRNKIEERLELALRPAEPPTLEEVLEEVSTHGVLRGPVDWVFPAWILYVEYATQRIAEAFPLSEEERRRLFHFRDTLKRLLRETWTQAKKKLEALYEAVVEGTYRVVGNRLYAPDGTWMYVTSSLKLQIQIHGISASAYFPDVLKLPREKLELLQLGWRASDEGQQNDNRPYMGTTQPWQVFAWAATRYRELYMRIALVNLTQEGVSVTVHLRANSWRQKWSKDEAISLVADYFRRGEWAPMLTMWLGDGYVRRRRIQNIIVITTKEPWRLGLRVGPYSAIVARGREAFVKLREAADVYGELLDLLKSYKWIYIKLVTDYSFRKLNKKGAIIVADVVMRLRLVGSIGVSLLATYYTRDPEKARIAADKLKAAGLRPKVSRAGPNYVVYIATADLLKLAEKDEATRRAIALYLAEKAKNGTPRQREIAEKILKKYPLFSLVLLSH